MYPGNGRAAFGAARPAHALVIPYETPTRIGAAQVVLHSAAHCLGAAMIEVRTDRGTLVYTGDYELRFNPFAPASRIPRCDELVMECTFGEPRYVFPPDETLITRPHAFVDAAFAEDATPVVLAYALGKGQEARFHLTTPSTCKAAMVQGLAKKRICDLTGWACHPGAHNIYKGCDLVLPLSDHTDLPAEHLDQQSLDLG